MYNHIPIEAAIAAWRAKVFLDEPKRIPSALAEIIKKKKQDAIEFYGLDRYRGGFDNE